jgi:hypothetical protein
VALQRDHVKAELRADNRTDLSLAVVLGMKPGKCAGPERIGERNIDERSIRTCEPFASLASGPGRSTAGGADRGAACPDQSANR